MIRKTNKRKWDREVIKEKLRAGGKPLDIAREIGCDPRTVYLTKKELYRERLINGLHT